MRSETRSLIWGFLLILLGVLFLGNNLAWFNLDWENLWPLVMILGGILFWIGWIGNRKEVGLLMPGTILTTYGLLFLYCSQDGWYQMDRLWPVFLLGPGLGFFFMYLLGSRERGLLIPASILTVLAILFWAGENVFHFFWPILLIGVGIYLLFFRRRGNISGTDTKPGEPETGG